MSSQDALLAARREFGNVTLIEETGRETWHWLSIERVLADLRYAVRQLRRSPVFTLAGILTLALGIGANTAVFSVVNGVPLRPLPFSQAERLVLVESLNTRRGGRSSSVSYPTFFDFRTGNQVFQHLVCYREDQLTLTGAGPAETLSGEVVSWDLFPMLRVQPELGRGFLPSEEKAGERVVVLSHELWTARFGGDPALVGKPVTLDGLPYTVVGIAPVGFNFPVRKRKVQLWTTLARDAASATIQPITEQRGARLLTLTGRLKSGVSIEAAQAQVDAIAAALAATYPDSNKNIPATYVRPELERLVGNTRWPVLILFGAVCLVLLIACANMANLLLARTADREREFAVRLAIGAARGRVVRQLLTENLLLAFLGSAAGVMVAWAALYFVRPLAGDSIPRLEDVRVDGRVLAFSALLALLTSVLFSIPPALRILRANVGDAVKCGSRGGTDTNDRLRGSLVVAQLALSLVLLSGASLLVAGLVHLLGRDLGFRPDNLLSFNISLPDTQYSSTKQVEFCRTLLQRLSNVPGVISAGAGVPLPLAGDQINVSFNILERRSAASDRPASDMAVVTSSYLRTIGTPLLQGREFTERDDANAPPVLVVNEAFARKFFPGENAVGKKIEPGAKSDNSGPRVYEIVGVVGNARQGLLTPEPEPIYYFSYPQLPWGPPTIVLRTAVPPLSLEPSIRQVVESLDKEVPIYEVRTLSEVLSSGVAGPRFHMVLLGSFAAIALLLTAVGLYGVLAYSVSRRTREIGVRIALGADRSAIVAMVLKRAMTLVLVGVPLGVAGAIAGARFLRSMIYGTEPRDVRLLTAACCLVIVTAAVAAYLPSRRAASVDPMQALRSE